MPHSTIVISDNEISREGLYRIISGNGFEVVSSARSGEDIRYEGLPDQALFIIDVAHADTALEILSEVLEGAVDARCVVLVDRFSFDFMMECFRRNANGFIVKSISCMQLVASLKLAALGERVMPSQLIDVLSQIKNGTVGLRVPDAKVDSAQLSSRELDVLCCLAAGQSNKEIARRLDLSEATVKVHVKAILRKLKVTNRTQAAMWGTTNKVVPRNVLHDAYGNEEAAVS